MFVLDPGHPLVWALWLHVPLIATTLFATLVHASIRSLVGCKLSHSRASIYAFVGRAPVALSKTICLWLATSSRSPRPLAWGTPKLLVGPPMYKLPRPVVWNTRLTVRRIPPMALGVCFLVEPSVLR